MPESDVYGGHDPREMPAYSIPEAAHYLQIPPSTLRSWIKGWRYRTEAGKRCSAPLLDAAYSSRTRAVFALVR